MKADVINRRTHGVVYTPQPVADAVVAACRTRSRKIKAALEPSCGDGAFLRSLRKTFGPELMLTAVDIDALALKQTASVDGLAELVLDDFLSFAERPEKKGAFDLIVGNPPYVRRHNFSDPLKKSVAQLSERSNYPSSQLKNSWAAFVVAAYGLLSQQGILALVVPYELITVSYGAFLRDWLAERFRRIDIFIPDEKAFKEIDQDAVVLLASNAPTKTGGVGMHRVRNLENLPSRPLALPAEAKGTINDKSFLLDPDTRDLLHRLRLRANRVGDACTSVAGTVTAANDYFILSHEEVDARELWPWARPILKKGAFVTSLPVFKGQHFETLATSEPCYLIDFFKEGAPASHDGHAGDYIQAGEERGLNLRYKPRCRSPWYRIPVVAPTEGLFFKRSHRLPKLCINEAGVLSTDTAYQVTPRPGYTMKGICYSFYNSLTSVFCEIDGRFYGGGVLELTPNEFRGLPLWYQEPKAADFKTFTRSFRQHGEAMEFGDRRLSFALSLTSTDQTMIAGALGVLQDHRLRHG
ncbi:Eco57I restriction-modification methylase domain-containing protein [Ensifer adhaerens]|uniref:Eco57I restriction-modification methylase domain-containing protein n=1 Tax=Ensifer adhaerens TaxID=106592 RepID=UPI00132EDFE7|nr:Eco57I restriction-modification methylase domain-containing protein [Ensifer adhaerens]QHG74441.1 hypothetical protein DQW09_32145 [Ensifer adhaerens]